MEMHDRISIKTPYGTVKLIITEGYVEAYIGKGICFLHFEDKGKYY